MTYKIENEVALECVVSPQAAIATISYYTFYNRDSKFDVITTSGTAVRHPSDKFDQEVAENLAIGRALENLGKKLQRRANGVVKQNEDNEARKVRQKAEAAKALSGKSSRKRSRRG